MKHFQTSGAAADADDFQALFATHPSPMWVYDPETLEFLAVNDAAFRLYGYSPEQLRAMTVLDIRPAYERLRMKLAVKARSDVEKAERWVHLKASGETFEVLTYGRVIRFDGVDAILAIVQDQTALNEAQRQANAAQNLMNAIIENLPTGVFVKDMRESGAYVMYNRAAGALDAQEPAHVLGRRDEELFPAEQVAAILAQDRAVNGSKDALNFEECFTQPDGEARIVKTTKKMLDLGDGEAQRYLLGIAEDVTQERMFGRRLEKLAMEDALTGLSNRTAFVERLSSAVRSGKTVALAYLDVDNFKEINDSGGHSAGDGFLKQLALRLSAATPQGLVARLGGDEFALVVELDRAEQAIELGEALLAVFAEPFALDASLETVSCSLGIAIAPDHANGDEDLLRLADIALYAAKEAGRATYRIYTPQMSAHALHRRQMVTELREAIAGDQLELYFQPLFQLSDRSLTGFEALVRWRHPRFGLIGPGHFIDLAESSGLIAPLGEWVLRQAIACAAEWPPHLTVAVNLSPRQLKSQDVPALVQEALAQAGLAAGRLEIEITESVFVDDAQKGLAVFKALKAMGVGISIDDFGTGYSSLAYLRDFPFDKIKLDRSFIQDLEDYAGSLSIARAVVAIASGFGAVTLAEGIERESQARTLSGLGYDQGQGFHLGRPLPHQDALTLIAEQEQQRAQQLAG